jgi:PPM family protein phosphatase
MPQWNKLLRNRYDSNGEISMKVASMTDRGRVRKNNEDSFFADSGLGLLIVADGMGGHNGGEVASRIAVETIAGEIQARLGAGNGHDEIDGLIREAIGQANAQIRERAEGDPALDEMGTTLVLALCRGSSIHLAHLGDSRAYLVRHGSIRRLTEDHSLVAQMIKAGQLTEAQAPHFHLRHVVTRSLGNRIASEAEMTQAEWNTGDYLLLCSDGLTNMVADSELQTVIAEGGVDLERSCREAIERANRGGGRDNITAVLAYHD